MRLGGLALLGAGVVAAAVGLFTMGAGASGETVAAPPPVATIMAGPRPTTPPPAAATPTPAASASAPATTPGAAGAGSAGGAGSGSAAERAPVRVYNNSTISGLATRAAADFEGAGWPVEQVANYPSGIIPTSTVYYRPGTAEQASAQAIGGEFGLRAEPRFDGLAEASPGLIVIVTDDYQQPRAGS